MAVTELRHPVANAYNADPTRWITTTFLTAVKLHINFY